ncbi:MAG: hypothetical protein CM15mP86_19340 [Gammaproteobacteria bacterium]|nr:MAG: hypothetical protein CM15mP86_19340 [Gammaproteobacteria bacterium]
MYTFIENIEDLAFLNDELIDKPYVAIDTEFRRTSKDNMKLALMQVNDGEEIYLIDTVQIKEPKMQQIFFSQKMSLKFFIRVKKI